MQPTYLLFSARPILTNLSVGPKHILMGMVAADIVTASMVRLSPAESKQLMGAPFKLTTLYAEPYVMHLVRQLEVEQGVPRGSIMVQRVLGIDTIGHV